jgi:ElaB/YqjD/DUF883 family membrane-anchored ribosome-binding protein
MEATKESTTPEALDNGRTERAKKAVIEGFETAKGKVAEGYEKVSHKAHEVWDKAADKSLNDVVHSVNEYVKHKPGKSLLMAAGAGLLLGLLLRGRRG